MIPVRDPGDLGFDVERLSRVSRLLEDCVEKRFFPGCVLLVLRHGSIAYYESFGFSVVDPCKSPAKRDTIYDLASLTKVVVTTPLVMLLVERGEISLWDPIHIYIPEFRGHGRDEITVWHLLTHTSGLPAWQAFYMKCKSREEVYKLLLSSDIARPLHKPGERMIYSDLGFMLLGLLIETMLGMKLDEAARKFVFEPLGMDETMFNPPPELRPRIAATEYCKFRGRMVWGEVHDENAYIMNGISGHAGVFSTASDLALYAEALLKEKLLSPVTIRVMTSEQVRIGSRRRALGWDMKPLKGYCSGGDLVSMQAYGHTGFTGTSIWIDPSLDLAVVFLTNRVHYGRESREIIRVRPLLHNMILSSIASLD